MLLHLDSRFQHLGGNIDRYIATSHLPCFGCRFYFLSYDNLKFDSTALALKVVLRPPQQIDPLWEEEECWENALLWAMPQMNDTTECVAVAFKRRWSIALLLKIAKFLIKDTARLRPLIMNPLQTHVSSVARMYPITDKTSALTAEEVSDATPPPDAPLFGVHLAPDHFFPFPPRSAAQHKQEMLAYVAERLPQVHTRSVIRVEPYIWPPVSSTTA
ncbi:hypothetical protein EUX98_g3098 [Antrodiella citrinella]|uniref:Uncharacterized protein n=1 Tax=Antrodiella citrinella TaxID=2447956 RepID=A0A4S4N086_9APHY|nr:hypothetical protein EUX98_g3098 [Antrodiella citrinella]